jgi:uncharacterized repeat protein (TIGR01451 family)
LLWLTLAGFLLLAGKAFCQAGSTAPSPVPGNSARLMSAVPLAFEENDGQLAPELSFLGRAQSYSVAIEPDRLRFFISGAGSGSTVDVRFAGSRGGSPVSLSGVAYRSNYFLGSDPSRWHEGVANFSRVGIRQIYPGVDTEFYDKNGELEHDFVLAPGADPKSIRLDLRSAQHATLTPEGDAVIPASSGELRFRKPVAYQFDAQGKRVLVDASYRLAKNNLSFALGSYDHSRTLVIDPVILFATYVAGSNGSTAAQLATATDTTNAHNVHLYLTGTVSSVLGFPAPGPVTVPTGITNTVTNVFVASLTTSNLGGVIDWITFIGGNGNSTASAITTSGAAGKVFVGGQTAATAFTNVGGYQPTFPLGGGAAGFVTSLSAASGATPASTFVITVDPTSTTTADATNVTGLSVGANGNLYLSGYGPGTLLPLVDALAITPAAPPANGNNAFLVELNPTLTTASLATYVQSEASADYHATAVQVDPTGVVFVSGTTSHTFPTAIANTTDYTGCTAQTAPATNAFVAEVWPPGIGGNTGNGVTTSKLGFTAIVCGDGLATANGLTLSPDRTKLYLIGDTTSIDIASHIFYSNSTTPAVPGQLTASGLTGLQATPPASASTVHFGYALEISGLPIALAYLGATSGNTTFYASAYDNVNGLLQLAGTTAATRTDLPGESTATTLPSGQDTSLTQSAGTARGLLYSLTANLATADAISYFGAPVTQSTVRSVQSDGTGNTYALVDDNVAGVIANQLVSFTSASAIQGQPPSGMALHYTYVAELQGTNVAKTPTGLTLAVDPDSPSIDGNSCTGEVACEIATGGTSKILYTWNVTAPSGIAHDVVFNFPEQDSLASPANPAYTITLDGQAANTSANGVTFACASKRNNNGTTCSVSSLTAATSASPHVLTLQGTVASTATAGTSFTFDGNAADAEGEYSDAPQTAVTLAAPVSISLSYTQTSGLIHASSDNTGTNGTPVTYTATVTNTGATDSPNTTLSITALPPASKFLVTSITAFVGATNVIAKCDGVAGTGCAQAVDVPAGQALVYIINGVYLGPSFGTTAPGSYPFIYNSSATALPLTTTNTKQTAPALTTSVDGNATLSVAVTAPTYATGQSFFSLTGAVTLTYTVAVTNNGTNASGSFSLTNTLPTGFAVSSATCAPASCTNENAGTGFTASSLAAGSTLTYTIKGSFSDHGAAGGDAVPTNASTSTVTDTATISAQPAGTYDAGLPVTSSATVNVQRSVHLKITISSTGSLPAGTYLNQPAFNLGTAISYNYTITNTGPSIDFNVPLANVFTTPISASYVTVTAPVSGGATCSSGYASCAIASVPGSGTSTFTFTVRYPDNLPPAFPPPASFSAVPTNATDAPYNYRGAITPYTYAVDISPNPADNQGNLTVNVYRTAALSLTPTVTGFGSPCASGPKCFYMANSASDFDTATYTVAINNGGPNLATNATLTIPLPANFLVNADPTVAFNGLVTTGAANQLACTYQNTPTAPNSAVCQGYVPLSGTTATITSKFSTATVPGNAAFTTVTAPSVTTVGASAISSSNTIALPGVEVDRAANLVAAKLVNSAPGNVSPNGFSINGVLAVNLNENVVGDANGKNDTIQITEQVGNAGLNDATGVVITDTLPPYFILTQKPAFCTVPNTTPVDASGNYITGAAPVTMTCTLQNAVPRGTATAGSGSTHGSVSGAFVQVVYYGKFVDNGLLAGALPPTQSSAGIQFNTLSVTSTDLVNLGTKSDSISAPVAPIPVMRAAHLHFTVAQYVQPGDAALNPVGGVSGPGIAEAQLGANGGQVINPVRYQVRVTNDGPNIATGPTVSSTLPLNPGGAATRFVNVSQSIEPSSTPGFPVVPPNCAGGQACQNAGVIPVGAAVLYNVDGNFDLNTLVEGNSGARTFASAVMSASLVDSNPTASAGGDQQTSLPLTVVNTPVGANFTMAPLAANLTQPLNLQLGTVQTAGITGLAASGAAPAPAPPTGPSPNPPDNGAVKSLYQFGQGGVYYTLGTTAGVSTATANKTLLCLSSIPDTFKKPERVLLWALSNAPTGTAFGAVPHFTSNGTMGDITTLVVPQGGGSYSVPATSTSYPPPPAQPQPAQVCGVLNGLADAANPTVLAVLEPVNFAPFIRTAVTAANSGNSQPGKGVTAAAAQVDLTISPQNNYDYNDADPCYTGSGGTTRSTCNDNVQVTTFLFGGGNLIGDAQQVHTYFYGDIQSTPKPQFNLPAGQPQLYLVLADQLGAQGYKETTSGGNTQVCDPGNPSTAYTPTTPACPLPNPLPGGIAVPPAQTILPLPDDSSVTVALLIGNVGFGGSTGLIPLPQTPTPEAVAHVTTGQTAGFVWNWLTEQPQVQGAASSTPPVLTLACVSADGTNLAEKGITCNVQQTYTYATGSGNSQIITAPPAIYVVTTGNTAVGALHDSLLSRDMQVVAAIVFPIGAIPLVLLLRRRKALKLSGWLAVLFLVALVGLGIGCGSSGFHDQGGTTTTATPAGTYEFIVTATGTDSSGAQINIKTYPFAVTVSAVQ